MIVVLLALGITAAYLLISTIVTEYEEASSELLTAPK